MNYKELDFSELKAWDPAISEDARTDDNCISAQMLIRNIFRECGYGTEDDIIRGEKLLSKIEEGGAVRLDEATEKFPLSKMSDFLPKINLMPRATLKLFSLLFLEIRNAEVKDL